VTSPVICSTCISRCFREKPRHYFNLSAKTVVQRTDVDQNLRAGILVKTSNEQDCSLTEEVESLDAGENRDGAACIGSDLNHSEFRSP
jgi:hypothetical protein